MNNFTQFRAHMEEELLCGVKSPISDEIFFKFLYGMQPEEYETLIALEILYNLPAREEYEGL